MNRRHRNVLLVFLILLSLFTVFCTVSWTHFRNQRITPALPYRACIVTLIRSDTLISLNKVINMLHSLNVFFVNLDRYPIYLFHEPSLTNATKEQILRCSRLTNIHFRQISFHVPIASNRSGYASMCQFWSYDLWFKSDFIRNQCDYVMRFDDDSYLINSTQVDLFERFHREQLDYVYRIVYHDNNGLDFIRDNLRSFLSTSNKTRKGCVEGLCTALNGNHGYDGLAVYNNFFLIRVQVYYEHPIIETYLRQLIAIDAFYRYRVGDANIQTISLLLPEKPLKIKHWRFAYNHNIHGGADLHPTFVYYTSSAFMWHFQMKMPNITCRKLIMAMKFGVLERYM